jgi:L-2-hydroxyglutarate oxidase LhgO
MEHVDCVVVGAGVIGLAAARALARAGREVLVLEAGPAIGGGISARNSAVIHAGLYYPPGSLKARLCRAGRDALYRYCAERGVAHRRTGKLLVATNPAQHAALAALQARARENGVEDLVAITPAAVQLLEPQIRCTAALLSPATGIVDVHGLMLSLQADAQAHGAICVFNTPVLGGQAAPLVLHCGGAAPMRLRARTVINAAGLDAPRLARNLQGFPAACLPELFYAKGNYFALQGPRPRFTHLIYPMPDEAGLGIHVTLDLAGQVRFGPDVEWTAERNYRVDPARAPIFYQAIRRYWPALADGALVPEYAGIRPKLAPAGHPPADFVIQGPATHGQPGLVNLFGIDSPGLTAALAIAEALERVG